MTCTSADGTSIAFAAGLARALREGRGSRWAPALTRVYGAGLIAAGTFHADPANGFGPGAPAGKAAAVNLHGMLHIACAGVGFLALIAACFVLAADSPPPGSAAAPLIPASPARRSWPASPGLPQGRAAAWLS